MNMRHFVSHKTLSCLIDREYVKCRQNIDPIKSGNSRYVDNVRKCHLSNECCALIKSLITTLLLSLIITLLLRLTGFAWLTLLLYRLHLMGFQGLFQVHQSSLKPTAFTKLYSSSPVKLIPRSTRMLKRKENSSWDPNQRTQLCSCYH